MIRALVRFRRFVRPYRGVLVVGALLSFVAIALGVAEPWPLKVVVDDVLRGKPGSGAVIPHFIPRAHDPHVLLGIAAAMLVVIVLFEAIVEYFSDAMPQTTGQRIGNDLREAVFAHLQSLSLRFHVENSVGDLASRVTGDVDNVQEMLIQILTTLIPNVLLVVAMLAVMLRVDPAFTAVSLAVSPFLAIAIYRSSKTMKEASRKARRRGGQVAAAATETLHAIQVVQGFTLEDSRQARFRSLNKESLDANLIAVRQGARLSPLTDVAAAVSVAILLWFGANRVLDGRLKLGVLLVFVAYLQALYKPVRSMGKASFAINRGLASAERVLTVLDTEPDVADSPHARPLREVRGRVRLEGVTFTYGREAVLDNVDFSVDPGEVVAIVGPTGAGKSTLVSLIPRFFDPQSGVVRIDGHDVRDITVRSLRDNVALVLQDSVLFAGTLRQNIACGRPGATDDEVLRAMHLALVEEFSDRFPDGLDTVLGERGVNLSGGQRQRIAIARALVRDAPILILDEPTSALDASSERLVVAALKNLMAGRTTIVIAHRLSTIRGADRILVLESGRIIEEGKHDDLVAAGGMYARMSAIQGTGSEGDADSPVTADDGAIAVPDGVATVVDITDAARRKAWGARPRVDWP